MQYYQAAERIRDREIRGEGEPELMFRVAHAILFLSLIMPAAAIAYLIS